MTTVEEIYGEAPPLTKEQEAAAQEAANRENTTSEEGDPASFGVGNTGKFWAPGRTLRVRFMGGGDNLRTRVMKAAKKWSEHANIKFVMSDDKDAEVRVAFNVNNGTWAQTGTWALGVAHTDPTMNFSFINKDTDDPTLLRCVLFAFGQVLGLMSEWRNNNANIPWNREKLTAVYKGYGWTKEAIDNYFFTKLDPTYYQFSKFDPKSIMCPPISDEFTTGQFRIEPNYELSEGDKRFIGKLYPF